MINTNQSTQIPSPQLNRAIINQKLATLFPSRKMSGVALPLLIAEYKKGIAINKTDTDAFGLYGDLRRSVFLTQKLPGDIPGFLYDIIYNPLRHQWSLNMHKPAVIDAAARLQRLYPFNYRNFEDFYDAVYAALTTKTQSNVPTFMGRCTAYDTALRLGWVLSPLLEPIDYVYVHGDLVKTAKRILHSGGATFRISTGQFRIPKIKFVNVEPAFRALDAKEIEDFLCVYA